MSVIPSMIYILICVLKQSSIRLDVDYFEEGMKNWKKYVNFFSIKLLKNILMIVLILIRPKKCKVQYLFHN